MGKPAHRWGSQFTDVEADLQKQQGCGEEITVICTEGGTGTRLWCPLTGHRWLKPHYLSWAQRDHVSPSFLELREML